MKFSTCTIASSGLTIRKYATAFTRAGTLSFVITSCGGMFSVIVRRSTLTIRSTIGISRKRPGPFGAGSSRPSRKTMPRSYSRATLIALSAKMHDEEDDDREDDGRGGHDSILCTSRVRPSSASTWTCSPGRDRVAARRPPELAAHEARNRRGARPLPCPTISCGPTRTGLRRTATAFAIANAQKPPSSAVTVTTSGTDVWYGAGALWKSVIRPTAIATSPDERQRAVRRDVRVDDEQRRRRAARGSGRPTRAAGPRSRRARRPCRSRRTRPE